MKYALIVFTANIKLMSTQSRLALLGCAGCIENLGFLLLVDIELNV